MNFSEKLKALRKQFRLSQEQLAEKLNVSRQAITKWETDGGLPDIENLMAIAALFSVSLDDLLSAEKPSVAGARLAYESVTEYDISRPCRFDIHTPGAAEVRVSSVAGEKLRILLASNVLQTIEKDYKTQIDDYRNRLDVDIRRTGDATDAQGKDALCIDIALPASFCEEVELSATTASLRLAGIAFPFELSGKAGKVFLSGATGRITLDCNSDMEIHAVSLPSVIEFNQINATSTLMVPLGAQFYTKIKGKSNRISYAENGNRSAQHDCADADNLIELAGMNAELLINRVAEVAL